MTGHALPDALTLTPTEEGAFSAVLTGDFSNGPSGMAPENGKPFGGLLAAHATTAMRQGLGIKPPLRSLSVQYLAAAGYDAPVVYRPRLLRGGRSVAFASVEAGDGKRMTLHATATYGADNPAYAVMKPLAAPPPPLDSLDPERQVGGGMAPHFTKHVEYRMQTGPSIGGGNIGKPAVERLWMRTRDGHPLDEARLCFLLDALYPPAFTVLPQPLGGASVDLRYDILTDPTPELAPDGWAFFEFRMLDLNHGWTLDDVVVWGADGTPIALARQRRKLF